VSNEKSTATISFPVLSILGIVFIVLKLTDQIDWAWKWVLAPFWIPWVLVMGFFAIIALVTVINTVLDTRENKKVGKGKGVVGKDGRRY